MFVAGETGGHELHLVFEPYLGFDRTKWKGPECEGDDYGVSEMFDKTSREHLRGCGDGAMPDE